jgi:hypothetical protein
MLQGRYFPLLILKEERVSGPKTKKGWTPQQQTQNKLKQYKSNYKR